MDDTMGQYMEARKQYHQLSARVRIAQQHTA